MLTEELKARLSEIEKEIARLEAQIAPIQEPLDRFRESRRHVMRLLELENGASPKAPRVLHVVPRKRNGDVHWQAVADQHGYYVGGDSAHRVVRRRDPALHAIIEHQCEIDKRDYP